MGGFNNTNFGTQVSNFKFQVFRLREAAADQPQPSGRRASLGFKFNEH